jgi:RNA polymerase sigma factor (sigma-70 family)
MNPRPPFDTPPSLLDRLRESPDDAASWSRFHELYRPLLLDWARRYGVQHSDADDLVQEALQTLLREVPRFRYDPEKGRFRDWMRRILVHRVRRFWDARQAQADEARLAELEAPGELQRLWDRQHDEHVLSGLMAAVRRDFAPLTWEAFLRVTDGEKAGAVAQALGMTPNAVRLARSHVLRRLREEARGLVD